MSSKYRKRVRGGGISLYHNAYDPDGAYVRKSALALALLLMLTACNKEQKPQPSAAWDKYVADYLDAFFAAHPDQGVSAGRHEFDGKLPDFSKSAFDAEIGRLRIERAKASAFQDGLDNRQKFERDYLISTIDADLFWLEDAQWPYKNPFYYSGIVDPAVYLTRPYAPLNRRMRVFVDYEKALPVALRQIQTNLRTPMPRTYVDQGRLTFGGLATYFEHDVPGIFVSVQDAALQDEFASVNAEAIRVLKSLDSWFESQRATATDNFQIGPELFRKMLHATERVDLSTDQLQVIAKRDLDRNLAAIKEECAKYAPGKSLLECTAKANADKAPGKPVEAARAQLDELRKFVVDHDLVTIPGKEQALVAETPPYNRWNLAYIDIPGPYENGLPSVYYISPPDPKWPPAEQKAYLPGKGSLLFTTVHEVMPGHFLQFLHANRSPSKFGQVFVGYAYAEGWAHYAEEMMWDAGLDAGDPEMHIGQLTEALLRNVRFLSAIGLHTGTMTVADSEKMFVEVGLTDAGNAKQQAARGTFDPAYLNYTMGKLMIKKLRDDWTATRGGRSAWKQFHDEFLKYGGPPIPLVRQAMLGPNAGSPL